MLHFQDEPEPAFHVDATSGLIVEVNRFTGVCNCGNPACSGVFGHECEDEAGHILSAAFMSGGRIIP